MAKLANFSLALLLAFSLVGFSVSQRAPESSPAPPPELSPPSPSPLAPAPQVGSPASPPSTSSPPSPPSDLAPGSSPTPLPAPSTSPIPSQTPTPSPTPAPSVPADLSHELPEHATDEGEKSDGMSGGKKAGIVIGVLFVAGMVVVGGMVYKKRRDNIRRAQYMTAARRDFL